jgi:hypothetical protein
VAPPISASSISPSSQTTWAKGMPSNALARAMMGSPGSDGHAMMANIGHLKLVYFCSPFEIRFRMRLTMSTALQSQTVWFELSPLRLGHDRDWLFCGFNWFTFGSSARRGGHNQDAGGVAGDALNLIAHDEDKNSIYLFLRTSEHSR